LEPRPDHEDLVPALQDAFDQRCQRLGEVPGFTPSWVQGQVQALHAAIAQRGTEGRFLTVMAAVAAVPSATGEQVTVFMLNFSALPRDGKLFFADPASAECMGLALGCQVAEKVKSLLGQDPLPVLFVVDGQGVELGPVVADLPA
jgi:hypothetical protein